MPTHGTNCTGVSEVSEICGRGQKGALSQYEGPGLSIFIVILQPGELNVFTD